jgi:hypothetical protein
LILFVRPNLGILFLQSGEIVISIEDLMRIVQAISEGLPIPHIDGVAESDIVIVYRENFPEIVARVLATTPGFVAVDALSDGVSQAFIYTVPDLSIIASSFSEPLGVAKSFFINPSMIRVLDVEDSDQSIEFVAVPNVVGVHNE